MHFLINGIPFFVPAKPDDCVPCVLPFQGMVGAAHLVFEACSGRHVATAVKYILVVANNLWMQEKLVALQLFAALALSCSLLQAMLSNVIQQLCEGLLGFAPSVPQILPFHLKLPACFD